MGDCVCPHEVCSIHGDNTKRAAAAVAADAQTDTAQGGTAPALTLPTTSNYTFGDWLESTAALQRAAYARDPRDHVQGGEFGPEGAAYFTWNAWALVVELGEMAGEVGWKPWATSRHVNREQVVAEAVDALHFMGNLLRMVDCTGEELTAAYKAKQLKNLRRQQEGYDGVSAKCRSCGRDVSEPSNVSEHSGYVFCICGMALP